MQPARYDVVIIGGGVSGLAAALILSAHGHSIAVVEQSGKLGGRCYSYRDGETGDVVDNGQHVLLGAYHQTLRYLELAGTRHALRAEPALTLPLYHPVRGLEPFRASSLPSPLHMTAGILRFRLLSLAERKQLLSAGLQLRIFNKRLEERLAPLTIDQWLDSSGQSANARQCLWHPIAVSVMNEDPACASALLFTRSLRKAFFGKPSDSAILIPTIGQTELYVTPVEQLLRGKGVEFILQDGVRALGSDDGRATGVVLRSGRELRARAVLSTIPYFALEKIVPPPFDAREPFSSLKQFTSSPIISIHLWSEEPVDAPDFAGLIGRRVQWIFNRRRLLGELQKEGGNVSCIISAAHAYSDWTNEQLVSMAAEDLRSILPEGKSLIVKSSVVIREQRATFSPRPEYERLRPGCETPIRGFYLAGDWTATGLPATIEGAIQSGFAAARRMVSNLGEDA